MTRDQITAAEAREAARRFVRKAKESQWTLSTAESCLPSGYILKDSVTDDVFMPLTVANATQAFRHYAARA